MPPLRVDLAIVGAGIVGLATALQLRRLAPSLRIALIDKEARPAQHQSGHNSGVIHSGVYYRPGSLKASNCQRGYRQLLAFCEAQDIPYDICGKLIVATQESELPYLEQVYQRGVANGLTGIAKIGPAAVRDIEPHIRAVAAIRVPQAGIVDYRRVAARYADLLRADGVDCLLGNAVRHIQRSGQRTIVLTDHAEVHARLLLNCAGLYSDKIAALAGQVSEIQILPFRGEYYELTPAAAGYINHLVYPVPHPDFPFLGVHFTRMIGGGIEAGPNAVLAFRREGYSRWDWQAAELWETLRYTGFRRLAAKHWRMGLGELHRSYSKRAFVRALQALLPAIQARDLRRSKSGVRATACNPQGELLDDYHILEDPGIISICNAPSPAATSSLSIGQSLAERVRAHLGA